MSRFACDLWAHPPIKKISLWACGLFIFYFIFILGKKNPRQVPAPELLLWRLTLVWGSGLRPELPGIRDGLALSCASRALPSVIVVEYPRPGPVSTIFLLVTFGPTLPLKSLWPLGPPTTQKGNTTCGCKVKIWQQNLFHLISHK